MSSRLERFKAYVLVNYEDALLDNLWSVSVDFESEAALCLSRRGDRESSVTQPHSVWMRRWGYPAYPSSFDEFSTAFAFNEICSVISSLPDILAKAKWINNQTSERVASNKITQLNIARSLGFSIPPTLVTTDERKVKDFASSVGRVVFKPVSGFQPQFRKFNASAQSKLESNPEDIKLSFGTKTENLIVFTQELTEEKSEWLEAIRWSPVIFQKRIEKTADIRVTVVGNRLFSCRIDSQSRPETETDFRLMNLCGLLPHELIDLPEKLEAVILSLMRNLGLTFGCVDLIQARDGDYYFLEVNPAGHWLWIEQVTGAPISKAIATELSAVAVS